MIKKLDPEIINLIAAGEVVERPSSAVKELLENSIDAESAHIVIDTKTAGIEEIVISDDGTGIGKEDLTIIFNKHTTSKITSKEDLDNVLTFGFRGEALSSVKEIAGKIIIESKKKDSTSSFMINSEGKIQESFKTSTGTKITINELYKNIPARKKFLKSNQTEQSHIESVFIQTALPILKTNFKLNADSKELFNLRTTNSQKERVLDVFGIKIANNTTEKSATINNIHIECLLGNLETAKTKNSNQFIYINNRFIKSPLISQAIKTALNGFVHKNLFPFLILKLNLSPKEIDINVHPRKLEVRFSDESLIFKTVFSFISSITKEVFASFRPSLNEDTDTYITSEELKQYAPQNKAISKVSEKGPSYNLKSSNSGISSAINFSKAIMEKRPVQKIDNYPSTITKSNYDYYLPFQIFNTYILFEKEEKIFLLDQHASDEALLFEKLKKDFSDKIPSKPLLLPLIVELKASDKNKIFLSGNISIFKKFGFEVINFGESTLQISSIPEILSISDSEKLFSEILEDINSLQLLKEEYTFPEKVYSKLASIACHGAIRAGQKMQKDEMLSLIGKVLSNKDISHCPHGRPILIEISKSELEKRFNRDI